MLGNLAALRYFHLWSQDPADLDRAEAGARRALEIDPDDMSGHITLANVYNQRGLYDEALAEVEIAAELAPGFDIPFLVRAIALLGKGAFLPALDSLERAVRINPRGNSGGPVLLAALLLRSGRTEEGVAILERARAANSDVILVRIPLAAHYVAEGRLDEARELAREIKTVNPRLSAESAAAGIPGFGQDAAELARQLRRAGMP